MAFSPRSFFLSLFALVLTLAAVSEARRHPRKNAQTVVLSNFQVPLSNGSASLTPPAKGLKLKAITLGRGTQNYTCDSMSAAPVSVGAKADLLDASVLLPHIPKHEAEQILNQLPSYLVNFNFDTIENSTIPILGQHIFSIDKVPEFSLGKVGTLKAKKVEGISAPAKANAVDWLKLDSVEGSVNLREAYRVHTAGGKPPKTCAGQPAKIEVPYATQYWFYG